MLHLTIDAVNADELYQYIRELNGMLPEVEHLPCAGNELVSCAVYPAPDEPCPVHEPVEATQEPPKAEPAEEPALEPEARQEAEIDPESPTAEEVRAALNELRKSRGTASVRKILAAHGADSFPSLDKARYAAVLKEAATNAAD